MTKFAYSAIDANGATIEGSIKADTVGDVRDILTKRDLVPLTVDQKRSSLNIDIKAAKMKRKELMHFSRQLAVFVKAGIPIMEALNTIAAEAQDPVVRKVTAGMAEQLRQGSTFSEAASSYPEAFPPVYLGVLGSAELIGNLDDTLDDLADYIDRDIQARSRITAALAYPMVVVVLAIGTVVILAGWVLPKFKLLFDELDVKLPLATRALLGMARFFSDLWFVPLGIVAFFIAVIVWMRTTKVGGRIKDRLLLKIPVVSGIIQYAILERFCRILSSMISAGVPLPEAMRVTTESTSNAVYVERLEEARLLMVGGAGFSQPLIATQLFPGAARQMFKVGEETGTLDKQLGTAAMYFDRELDQRVRRFTAMFEPAMIIFVGLIVGFVAVALVQAMYGVLGGYKG